MLKKTTKTATSVYFHWELTLVLAKTRSSTIVSAPGTRRPRQLRRVRLSQRRSARRTSTRRWWRCRGWTPLLAAAVAQLSALLACCASGSAVHKRVLPRVLACGFLVSLQSLLSTRGDELGMLEDVVVASEVLSTVTLRLVAPKKKKSKSKSKLNKSITTTTTTTTTTLGKEEAGAVETISAKTGVQADFELETRKSFPSSSSLEAASVGEGQEEKAVKAAVGAQTGPGTDEVEEQASSPSYSSSFPGVWARRATSGGLVLDVEVGGAVAAVVREASAFVARTAALSTAEAARAVETSRPPQDGVVGAATNGDGRSGERRREDAANDNDGGSEDSREEEGSATTELVGGGNSSEWELLASLPLVGVVFQQGINEQQAVCNALGSHAAQHLQSQVNSESLDRLRQYFKRYRAAAHCQALQAQAQPSGSEGSEWSPERKKAKFLEFLREVESWVEALANVERAVHAPPNRTNVHLILHASDLCRQLSGVHAICCKSGKDRTAMAVTLEEARLLCDHLRVVGGRRCCKVLRRFGVRRDNVEANTGQRKYAFNDVQRLFLPKCFQPPQGTYGGGSSRSAGW